jgi:dipeptidyl aminopeptidase/acylaminoacyl peptidase
MLMTKDIVARFFMVLWIAQASDAQTKKWTDASVSPLQITDLLSRVQFAPQRGPVAAISPDGTQVAYVSEEPFSDNDSGTDIAHEGRKELWVQRLSGGPPLRIGEPTTDNFDPAWSPDGKELAFYAGLGEHNRVALWNSETRSVHVLEPRVESTWPDLIQWTPDSTRLLVQQAPDDRSNTAAVEGAPIPKKSPIPAISVFTSSPAKSGTTPRSGSEAIVRVPPDDSRAVDLVLVDIYSDIVTALLKHVATSFKRFSPDGTKLLYTIRTGTINGDGNSRTLLDVYVFDFSAGSSTLIARDILTSAVSDMSWSHDGWKVAFVGGNLKDDASLPAGDHGGSAAGRCYIIDVRHPGMLRRLSEQRFFRGDAPRWSENDSTLFAYTWDGTAIMAISLATAKNAPLLRLHDAVIQGWIDAGRRVDIAVTRHDGMMQVHEVEGSGHSRLVFQGLKNISTVSFANDGARAAYVQADVSHPEDVWTADGEFGNAHQLTHLNPQIEERSLSKEEKTVTWRSRSGELFSGVVLLPAGYRAGKRYPTIVSVYGGEKMGTASRNLFGMWAGQRSGSYLNMQLFASRGYAVFVPNSTLHVGHPMRDIADVILAGVDKVVAMGIADPARLGVLGESYGGYSALSLIVQTDRFKAAVAMSGFSNLISVSMFMTDGGGDGTSEAEVGQDRLGATLWQDRNRYIANSPLFYLDRVQTPVLLQYGDSDKTVPPLGSRETFVGLRRLGKTATLVGYAGEGHILYKTSNQIDFWNRMSAWFEKYLSGGH